MTHQLQALHAVVSRITGSDPTNEKIRSILSRIEKESGALLQLVENPDPMKSAAAIDLVVNAEKARLRALAAESQAKLTNLVAGLRTAEEAARVAKANLVADNYSAEIRSVFRSLDASAKHAFLDQAINAGDASTVAAIVNVRPVLSGLSAEHSARYREAFLARVAPSNKGVADEMQVVCDTAIGIAEGLARPSVPAA